MRCPLSTRCARSSTVIHRQVHKVVGWRLCGTSRTQGRVACTQETGDAAVQFWGQRRSGGGHTPRPCGQLWGRPTLAHSLYTSPLCHCASVEAAGGRVHTPMCPCAQGLRSASRHPWKSPISRIMPARLDRPRPCVDSRWWRSSDESTTTGCSSSCSVSVAAWLDGAICGVERATRVVRLLAGPARTTRVGPRGTVEQRVQTGSARHVRLARVRTLPRCAVRPAGQRSRWLPGSATGLAPHGRRPDLRGRRWGLQPGAQGAFRGRGLGGAA